MSTSEYNPHTATMLLNDYHNGSREEAGMIIAENNLYPSETCGRCNERAYYKHTIGTHKCASCGALKLVGRNDGKRTIDWS